MFRLSQLHRMETNEAQRVAYHAGSGSAARNTEGICRSTAAYLPGKSNARRVVAIRRGFGTVADSTAWPSIRTGVGSALAAARYGGPPNAVSAWRTVSVGSIRSAVRPLRTERKMVS